MISDVNFRKTKALPAAAATANSDSLDLGAVNPGPSGLRMRISVPATPALVEDKDIDLRLEHSADDVTFVQVPTTGTMKITGRASSAGGAATAFDFFLPPHVLRYIRASADVESGGGSNIAVSFVLEGLV